MRRQKGQAVVEFALVLPFFLMLCFGIIFAGLLYSDYLTLSNLARESARAASIEGPSSYLTIKETGRSKKFLTGLYIWDGDNSFTIVGPAESSTVTVTLTLKRNDEDFPVPAFVKGMLPQNYKIEYSMYKEPSS